jgi:hypothetical protein
VFLHPVWSGGHVVRSGASGARNIDALFFMFGWAYAGPTRSTVGHTGICGSRSAFRCVQAVKHQHTIFRAHVVPVQIQEKGSWDTLHRTCIFVSGAIFRSHSAFRCVRGSKYRCTIFHAPVGPVWFACGGICGSRSAFCCAKHRCTIFHARVGPVRFS